ncbi:MAG: hypothetical protein R3D03_05760 [Geminicoccaceae bacterium]
MPKSSTARLAPDVVRRDSRSTTSLLSFMTMLCKLSSSIEAGKPVSSMASRIFCGRSSCSNWRAEVDAQP